MSVEGFVGYWGSGKTLAMVREIHSILKRDPAAVVFNNFGFIHPRAVEVTTIDDVITAACADLDGVTKVIAIDEIGGLMRARGYSTWPPAGDIVFQQGRKLNVRVLWTTQHWRFLDVNVRRVTEQVTECRGYFFKRLTPKGVYPVRKRARLFRHRVFESPNPDSTELPRLPDRTYWRRFNQSQADSYDTMRLIQVMAELLARQQEESARLAAGLRSLGILTDGDTGSCTGS